LALANMISRKVFIAASSATAVTITGSGASALPDTSTPLPLAFDAARFDRTLNTPAKHKMCFGSTYSGGGEVFALMSNLLDAYEKLLGEGRGSVHAIAVLYHGASFVMCLDDTFWTEVLAPYVHKGGADRARLWGDVSHNPYLHDPDRGTRTVEALASRGSTFFLCYNAIVDSVSDFAAALGESKATIYRKLLAAVVPSAMIVPAGVMAINAAQEARYSYLQATL